MTPTETAAKLRVFNDWRRGELDDLSMPDPREIGEALDAAVEMIDRQDRIFDAIERTWYKQGLDIRGASLSYFMTDVHSALEKSK